jgi:flagellar basal body rod protein FlgB
MLYGFFGRVTQSNNLREGLDASTQRTRLIADRVSKATMLNTDGFALPEPMGEPGSLQEGPIDLEAEMVSLADEQLYFETTTRLLQKAYEQIRTSMRDR